ncbi:MAG: YqgE/AlgH family protein [Pseudomonadota bacterium]
MPCLKDSLFGDTLVYVCSHSDDGCMGFIVNKPHQMRLNELIRKVDVSPSQVRQLVSHTDVGIRSLRVGGPVDENRGFILHSTDYEVESTIQINEEVSLTSTLTALEDVASKRGPRQAAVSLGYSSWAANQLEDELTKNFWLILDGPNELIFSDDLEPKYDLALGMIGIRSRAAFVSEPGHA